MKSICKREEVCSMGTGDFTCFVCESALQILQLLLVYPRSKSSNANRFSRLAASQFREGICIANRLTTQRAEIFSGRRVQFKFQSRQNCKRSTLGSNTFFAFSTAASQLISDCFMEIMMQLGFAAVCVFLNRQ